MLLVDLAHVLLSLERCLSELVFLLVKEGIKATDAVLAYRDCSCLLLDAPFARLLGVLAVGLALLVHAGFDDFHVSLVHLLIVWLIEVRGLQDSPQVV